MIQSLNDERPRHIRDRTHYVGELAPVSVIRRPLNQNPYVDEYVARRAAFYIEKYQVDQAVDAVTVAIPESVAASIERYLAPAPGWFAERRSG